MKLDQIDLAFLHLAVSKNGSFNEQDLVGSDLAYLGVGRTLDKIAYLKEKNLIKLADAAFAITDEARQILWDKNTPLKTRILNLLAIKSFEESDVSKYLLESHDVIQSEIEKIRMQGLIMFTTIKKDDRIIRVCEIMQEGVNHIQNQSEPTKVQLQKLLNEISIKVQNSKIDDAKIREVLEKIRLISTELG